MAKPTIVALRSFGWIVAISLVALLQTYGARAAESHLADFLDKAPLAEIFPGADRLGPVERDPPAAAAYKGSDLVGYVFLNADVVNATGYSGRPVNVVIGVDTSGTIVGAKLVQHHEPIVLLGIPEQKIRGYIAGYVGSNPATGTFAGQGHAPDIISGATVTVMVLGDTISKSTLLIARSRGLGSFAGKGGQAAAAPKRAIDLSRQGSESWEQLLSDGSASRLHLTIADINRDFGNSGDPRAAQRPEPGPDDDTFVDLYVAMASAPVVGRSLLGQTGYDALRQRLTPGQQALVIMGAGRYSFRGSAYVRGGIFDRLQVVQDHNSIRFRDRDYERLASVAAEGAPAFPEIGLFTVPKGSDLDPSKEWRLSLLVQRPVGALDKVFITVDLPYRLPDKFLLPAASPPPTAAPAPTSAVPAPGPAPAPGQATVPGQAATGQATGARPAGEPLWIRVWQHQKPEVIVLGAALLLLTLIFFFQDWLVRRQRLSFWVRWFFLLFTLFWVGWYANAQLSVVNVLTLANDLLTGFRWDYFLMDPLIFVLWAATAAALLFWARGAFCGWLCPFGALQEFANRLARRIGIPQLAIPWGVHERLWPIKYIVFLGLFGFSLYSLASAERLSEVEPFKTAIILKFLRAWPFVLYAVALVVASLFVERFFCRYLCPLGAAIAIPARIRMFDWLKRYKECGNPCQRCANECPVSCIHPDGHINPNECIYCMHCQELYWDEHRCPVMIQKRLKRERLATMSTPPPAVLRPVAKSDGGE